MRGTGGRGRLAALAAALAGWTLTALPPVPAGTVAATSPYGRVAAVWWPWPAGDGRPVGAPRQVRLGGLSIGVLVRVRGLVVMGVEAAGAVRAGVRPGDVITAAGGVPLRSRTQLTGLVDAAGRARHTLTLTVAGGDGSRQVVLEPVRAPDARHWRLGLKVQARFSGVGTLTFWDAGGRRFVALGHSVVAGTRGTAVQVQGTAYPAAVVDVVPSTPGSPGEKVGVLADPPRPLGTVDLNGSFGIAGRSREPARAPLLPLAAPAQVHPGPAWLYTALSGSRPQRYRVRILMTMPQDRPRQRGILFQVTDPRLLAAAGGIVQGMSGSPLVEDGRLVGAVTHVLVNRPQLGYACYAVWMAAGAGWDRAPGPQKAAKSEGGRQESRLPTTK